VEAETTQQEHLTDYERALCYYTLPRVVSPITFGLIIAYAVCFLEAVAVLTIGLVLQNSTWTNIGTIALIAISVFGVIIFTARALINEVKRRQALEEAEGVPNAESASDCSPDPFAEHTLLRYAVHSTGTIYRCQHHKAEPAYTVEHSTHPKAWTVTDTTDESVCRAVSLKRAGSFSLSGGAPSSLVIFQGEHEIARAQRPFSLTAPRTEIQCQEPNVRQFIIRSGSIYLVLTGDQPVPPLPELKPGHFRGERLIGRIYELRSQIYLDIEAEYLDDALLAYYTTLF
jgi:hypothetical protein